MSYIEIISNTRKTVKVNENISEMTNDNKLKYVTSFVKGPAKLRRLEKLLVVI
jgi:hypothetical protein